MLLAHRTAAWSSSTPPLEIAPKHTAATAARKPTTVAWTCRAWEETEDFSLLFSLPWWKHGWMITVNTVHSTLPVLVPDCCTPWSTVYPDRPFGQCWPENMKIRQAQWFWFDKVKQWLCWYEILQLIVFNVQASRREMNTLIDWPLIIIGWFWIIFVINASQLMCLVTNHLYLIFWCLWLTAGPCAV